MIKFKLSDLEQAVDFVSMGSFGEHTAVLCRETGRIYLAAEGGDLNEIEEAEERGELNGGQSIELPHRKELDLGKRLVFQFVEERFPDDLEKVQGFFNRRGAYGAYKDWLHRRGALDDWYAYESARERRAISAWCTEQGLVLEDDLPPIPREAFRALSLSPCIVTEQYEETREFYLKYFSATLVFDCEWYMNLQLGEAGPTLQFMRFREDGPPACHPAGLIYNIAVADVDAEYGRLTEEAGLKATIPLGDHPWGDRGFAISDPNGISVYLFSERSTSPEFRKYFKA